MVMDHRNKLACDLIRSHFGELVERVCICLLEKGSLAMPEIARSVEMSVPQLRNCLLVLVQHNCVQGFKVEQEAVGQAPPKVFTSYIVLVDNILHRMRFPKFLVIVREELGDEAESLVEGLLEHGRLTLEQVIQRAAARASTSEAGVEKSVKQTFVGLVRSRFIERCPAPDPVVAPKSSEPPRKAARGTLKGKVALAGIKQPDKEEDRIVAAAAALDTERFRMPSSLEGFGDSGVDAEDGSRVESECASSGQKRKRDALVMDAKTMALVEEKEVLWRANFEEFICKLRHQACIAHVQSRIEPIAGTVLGAMLEVNRSQETLSKRLVSAPLSMSTIMQAVTSTSEGRMMTMDRIRSVLIQMSSESVGFVTRTGDGISYVVNMQKIIESARRNEVEAIVLQRFGRESCRIYRLLMMKGQMEQKQVAGMAMVQLKNARELLYKLLKDQYVNVQEVAKTAEHSAQKAFYLWNVNWQTTQQLVLDDMYHAAANLGQRLAYELEKEQEALDTVKQIQVAKAAGSDVHVTLSQHELDKVKRVRQVANVLEASLLRLDRTILLFHDF